MHFWKAQDALFPQVLKGTKPAESILSWESWGDLWPTANFDRVIWPGICKLWRSLMFCCLVHLYPSVGLNKCIRVTACTLKNLWWHASFQNTGLQSHDESQRHGMLKTPSNQSTMQNSAELLKGKTAILAVRLGHLRESVSWRWTIPIGPCLLWIRDFGCCENCGCLESLQTFN